MRLNRTRSRLLLLALSLSPPAGAGRLSAGEAPSAGPAAMLADVETAAIRRRASRPFGHVEMAGVTYFTAHDRSHGWELWRSDGTDIGTSVLADILPGPIGSFPRDLTVMGDRLYFTAFDGIHGFGLWSSDGTPAGTRLVKGAEGDFLRPGQLTAYGATLLFTAGPRNKPALWRSDGTTPGTQKVLDLTPSDDRAAFAYPRSPGVLSLGQVWFMSRSGYRRVLWRTDGTTGGTTRVWTDTHTAPWRHFDIYAAFPGGVLFRGKGLQSDALWRSDGTPAGTFALAHAPLDTFLTPDWFVTLGSWTYFLANPSSWEVFGYTELWRTDGSVAGTTRRTAFGPEAKASQLTSSAGRLFVAFPWEVRSNDGTSAVWSTVFTGDQPQIVAAPGGVAIAAAYVAARSNGLPGGTQWLSLDALSGYLDQVGSSAHTRSWPLTSHPALVCLPSACWFRGRYNTQPMPWGLPADALWRSDLTPAGTRPVLPEDGHNRGSWPEQFVGYGGDVFFTTNGYHERHPWQSVDLRLVKVTATGVSVVEERPNQSCGYWDGPDDCRLDFLTALPNALLYFDPRWFGWYGTQGDPGGRWWAHQQMFQWSAHRGLGVINGRAVIVDFTTSSPQNFDLVAIDGGKDGAVPLGAPREAIGERTDHEDLNFTPVGNWLYFASDSGLWKTDGTPGSVQLVKAVAAGELTDVAGTLFFSSDGALWKSDGTPAGTVEVAPTQAAARLTADGSRLFFVAFDPARGDELWTSDGTPGGTQALADISPGPRSSRPDALVVVGARLFFSADDGVRGRELWRWDPVTGVSLVADIAPGPQGSLGDGPLIVAGGNHAWFPAWTATHGVELWSSDGTPAGTTLVQDIVYGPPGSHPRELTAIGSRLYFSADDGVHGQEPWSLPLP